MQKFIIIVDFSGEKDVIKIRLGIVDNHSDLLHSDEEECEHGGGFYTIENNTIIFYGESEAFGRFEKDLLLNIKNTKQCPFMLQNMNWVIKN